MYDSEKNVVTRKNDINKTIKPHEKWRKFSFTVVTAEDMKKLITASARSGSCGNPGR